MSITNKEIVEKVNAGFIENKPEVFLSCCDDNVEWKIVGDQSYKGIDAIREFLSSMKGTEPPKFNIDRIIADGDSVACFGEMQMKGDDGKDAEFSFCDAYRFENGKITRLQSFVVSDKASGDMEQKAVA